MMPNDSAGQGACAAFFSLLFSAAQNGTLLKLILTEPRVPGEKKGIGRLCRMKDGLCLQVEIFHEDGKATHENFPLSHSSVSEAQTAFAACFSPVLPARFARAHLLTSAGEAELRPNRRGAYVLLGGEKLSRALGTAAAPAVPPVPVHVAGNDREKKHILTGREPFLVRLGVADGEGHIFDKKGPKFRQINRFLELVRDTLPYLPKGKIRICDLCCGKSYLSFAVYHYFADILGYEVEMTGVDLKRDVIDYCEETARALDFTGLHFLCGNIAAYESPEPPALVVSLHACDTATDLVLDKAVSWGARVILSTPCCHHELNRSLSCPPLAFIAEHSMLRQKFCDAATDALRLKKLEAAGYRVAALELIDPDDTPKNIMLRAIRRPDADADTEKKRKAMEEYLCARRFLMGEKT